MSDFSCYICYTYLVTYNSKARTPNKVFRAVACDEGRGDVRNDISLSELDLNDLLASPV